MDPGFLRQETHSQEAALRQGCSATFSTPCFQAPGAYAKPREAHVLSPAHLRPHRWRALFQHQDKCP